MKPTANAMVRQIDPIIARPTRTGIFPKALKMKLMIFEILLLTNLKIFENNFLPMNPNVSASD